jgi:type IV secretory pathway VirB10-like protein
MAANQGMERSASPPQGYFGSAYHQRNAGAGPQFPNPLTSAGALPQALFDGNGPQTLPPLSHMPNPYASHLPPPPPPPPQQQQQHHHHHHHQQQQQQQQQQQHHHHHHQQQQHQQQQQQAQAQHSGGDWFGDFGAANMSSNSYLPNPNSARPREGLERGMPPREPGREW